MKAIQISKTLDAEALRRKLPLFNKPHNLSLPRQDTPYPRSFEQRPPTTNPPIQIIRKTPNPFIKPLIPGQPGPNTSINNFCRYCKSEGHLINNCAKLQYRNSMQGKAGLSGQASASSNVPGNETRLPVIGDVRREATEKPGNCSVHFEENIAPAQ